MLFNACVLIFYYYYFFIIIIIIIIIIIYYYTAGSMDVQSIASKKRSILSARVDSIKKRKHAEKRSVFCPHCDLFVCLKTFKKHKALYYDADNDSWTVNEVELLSSG